MQDQVLPKSVLKDDEDEFWQPTGRLNPDESQNNDGFLTRRRERGPLESSRVHSRFM